MLQTYILMALALGTKYMSLDMEKVFFFSFPLWCHNNESFSGRISEYLLLFFVMTLASFFPCSLTVMVKKKTTQTKPYL